MMGKHVRVALALAIVWSVGSFATVARADRPRVAQESPATCSIFEIEASNDDGGIDPQLAGMQNKLKRPPWNAWKSFKLLKKHDLVLKLKKPAYLGLTTGGKMSLLYRDKVDSQRLRLTVTLDDKDGNRVVESTSQLDSGTDWLIGGEKLPGKKAYFVGIKCRL